MINSNNGQDQFTKPSWRIRRRFFLFTVAFSAATIIYVAYKWQDLKIATELIVMATSLWLGVLAFYTAGATLEDIKLFPLELQDKRQRDQEELVGDE